MAKLFKKINIIQKITLFAGACLSQWALAEAPTDYGDFALFDLTSESLPEGTKVKSSAFSMSKQPTALCVGNELGCPLSHLVAVAYVDPSDSLWLYLGYLPEHTDSGQINTQLKWHTAPIKIDEDIRDGSVDIKVNNNGKIIMGYRYWGANNEIQLIAGNFASGYHLRLMPQSPTESEREQAYKNKEILIIKTDNTYEVGFFSKQTDQYQQQALDATADMDEYEYLQLITRLDAQEFSEQIYQANDINPSVYKIIASYGGYTQTSDQIEWFSETFNFPNDYKALEPMRFALGLNDDQRIVVVTEGCGRARSVQGGGLYCTGDRGFYSYLGAISDATEPGDDDAIYINIGSPKHYHTMPGGIGFPRGGPIAVDFNNQGKIIEVHENPDGSQPRLYYGLGQINEQGTDIDWLKKSIRYTTGITPSVTINNRGEIVEAHISENTGLTWITTTQWDNGATDISLAQETPIEVKTKPIVPSGIAINDNKIFVLLNHETDTTLNSKVGFWLKDRNLWHYEQPQGPRVTWVQDPAEDPSNPIPYPYGPGTFTIRWDPSDFPLMRWDNPMQRKYFYAARIENNIPICCESGALTPFDGTTSIKGIIDINEPLPINSFFIYAMYEDGNTVDSVSTHLHLSTDFEVQISDVQSTQIALSWENLPFEHRLIKRFHVYRHDNLVASLNSDQQHWLDKTVAPGQSYEYHIQAEFEDIAGGHSLVNSQTVMAYTPSEPPILANIQATQLDGSSLRLSWQGPTPAMGNDELVYKIDLLTVPKTALPQNGDNWTIAQVYQAIRDNSLAFEAACILSDNENPNPQRQCQFDETFNYDDFYYPIRMGWEAPRCEDVAFHNCVVIRGQVLTGLHSGNFAEVNFDSEQNDSLVSAQLPPDYPFNLRNDYVILRITAVDEAGEVQQESDAFICEFATNCQHFLPPVRLQGYPNQATNTTRLMASLDGSIVDGVDLEVYRVIISEASVAFEPLAITDYDIYDNQLPAVSTVDRLLYAARAIGEDSQGEVILGPLGFAECLQTDGIWSDVCYPMTN